jgi:predicted GNAT family acetyltransferase
VRATPIDRRAPPRHNVVPPPIATVDVGGTSFIINIDRDHGRFEATAAGAAAGDPRAGVIEYTQEGDIISMNHTEVAHALRGRGIGEALVGAALDYTRQSGWMVRPRCPFVAAFIKTHPQYQALVAPPTHS